ncbi:MAG: class I SAM-dependent methyltransferase [Candidatus Aenigmarchaeota archaeon]|nr:class I SAM-dependent methyltransferase [Candidatus Aenigmarchaeota archaeon]
MYDKSTADIWIKNYESRKDIFRVKYLEPYLKRIMNKAPKNAKILDVGCGWGTAAKFLRKGQEYCGIDPNTAFFDYIRSKFKGQIKLIEGSLPSDAKVDNESYDLVICSLVLHNIGDIKASIEALFSKAKTSAKVIIVELNDHSHQMIKKRFDSFDIKKKNHVKGNFIFPSGLKIKTEVYFYKETDCEREIRKYGIFTKKYIGPIFVAYEAIKI